MDYVRLYEEQHLSSLLDLNELVQEKYEDYPYHFNWIEKARDDIKIGKRIAFGAIFGDELIASVIVKDGLSSDLELKNFIVNSDLKGVDVNKVKDNLLKQVEIFAQRNDYEIFTIDILTKHLDDLNYFLSRGFTVSSLKKFSKENQLNIYTLTKELESLYNGDPLEFESIIDWILRRQYRFNLIKFERIKLSPKLEPLIRCFKYSLSLKNSIPLSEFSVNGEAVIFDFIDEFKDVEETVFINEIGDLFSTDIDIKFVFDSRKTKPVDIKTKNYFSKKEILKILGKESIPAKLPFNKSELGGALFYIDKNIKHMYFSDNPTLFDNEYSRKIVIYLIDGYGSSLNHGDTIFFIEKINSETSVLLGKAEIMSSFSGNYETIYSNLRGSNKDSFLKNERSFHGALDLYDSTYWNFLTSFHRTSKNRKSKTAFLIALSLDNFIKIKNIEFMQSLTKKTRDFVDTDKKESFTRITYLDKNNVQRLNRKYFKLNDTIPRNNNANGGSIRFSNPTGNS